MHRLTEADREVQATARTFADELIPYEVEAELAGGELTPEVAERQRARARELGLTATNIATEYGGRGLSTLQQVLVQEQGGRVTNGLAWCMSTPPGWLPAVATPYQREQWLEPSVRGDRGRVLRDYRGARGLRRRRPRRHRATRRRRLPARRREVARHVVQRGHLCVLPGPAGRRRPRGRARDVLRRPAKPRRPRRAHPGVHAHDRAPAPDRGVRGGARPRDAPRRARRATA